MSGNIRLAVCIIHAAHIPARADRMQRLREQLGVARPFDISALLDVDDRLVAYHEETTRGKWMAWHELSLRFFLNARDAYGATHALTLQDDVLPSPHVWPELLALIAGRSDQVICLDCAHPAARQIFAEGLPGYTTPDGMIGIGHVEPMSIVEDFVRWRTTELREGTLERITEDSLFGMFCMHRELPIFAPVPCPIDHELEIASTNEGFDQHWYRKPQVTWRDIDRLGSDDTLAPVGALENMQDAEWWAREVPHIGRFYESAHEFLPLILPGDVHELVAKYATDATPPKYSRFWSRITPIGP